MNKKLSLLFRQERFNLKPWQPTPLEGLQRIAAKCKRDEIAEIHIRLWYFQAERAMTPEWDGDTQDDIWNAGNELRQILKLISKS
jgi:hypothetical protein